MRADGQARVLRRPESTEDAGAFVNADTWKFVSLEGVSPRGGLPLRNLMNLFDLPMSPVLYCGPLNLMCEIHDLCNSCWCNRAAISGL